MNQILNHDGLQLLEGGNLTNYSYVNYISNTGMPMFSIRKTDNNELCFMLDIGDGCGYHVLSNNIEVMWDGVRNYWVVVFGWDYQLWEILFIDDMLTNDMVSVEATKEYKTHLKMLKIKKNDEPISNVKRSLSKLLSFIARKGEYSQSILGIKHTGYKIINGNELRRASFPELEGEEKYEYLSQICWFENETYEPTAENKVEETNEDVEKFKFDMENIEEILDWQEFGAYNHDEETDVYHYQYKTIKTCIEQHLPVYLAGPAGSGKNYVLETIAWNLGMNFYFANAIQDEFKLIGYEDAGGRYHETQFYKACNDNKPCIFFLDEMDASDEEVLVLLNAAIANGYFVFPNGKLNLNHVHFVAAGNTLGNGADELYTGRRQLDQATLDRFVIIDFDYDENIEYMLAEGNTSMLQFVRDLREQANIQGIRATFSYRCINMATKLLKTSMSTQEIIKIAIVKGLDKETIRTFKFVGNETRFHEEFNKLLMKL